MHLTTRFRPYKQPGVTMSKYPKLLIDISMARSVNFIIIIDFVSHHYQYSYSSDLSTLLIIAITCVLMYFVI